MPQPIAPTERVGNRDEVRKRINLIQTLAFEALEELELLESTSKAYKLTHAEAKLHLGALLNNLGWLRLTMRKRKRPSPVQAAGTEDVPNDVQEEEEVSVE